MKMLALDTATLTASVAVAIGDETPARVVLREARVTKHSDQLLTLVDEALTEAGETIETIDVIACGQGPGSFTGLRIGLATAKGLCLAREVPLVLISSLSALAARGPAGMRTLAVLDAYKNEVYAGLYRDGAVLAPGERVIAPELLVPELETLASQGPLAIVGDACDRYPALLQHATRIDDLPSPRASEIVKLSWARALRGEFEILDGSAPVYIRPSEAELVLARKKLV